MTAVRLIAAVALACTGAEPAAAQGQIALTIVRPGGGFLVTDGKSTVPLELQLRTADGPVPIASAKIRASMGRVRRTKIVADGRVSFLYTPPRRNVKTPEMLDVSVRTRSGDNLLEAFPIDVPPPGSPALSLQVEPSVIDATKPRRVDIKAIAKGNKLSSLQIYASDGALSSRALSRGPRGGLLGSASFNAPANMPGDAPSHFIVLAAASGDDGFAAGQVGVSATAPLRIRAEIEPGSTLILEGAERDPAPVVAPPDGYTTVYGTVRYGAKVRAFAVRDRDESEVPIVVPSGLVPAGLARAIPGQNVADGGTGATILVAVPPSPFGGKIVWPQLEIEGAVLEGQVELSDDLRALILRRPTAATQVTVLADFQPIGTIEFGPGHGTSIELSPDLTRPGERGALLAVVRDPFGEPTNHPVPAARTSAGANLSAEEVGPGQFRIALPSSTPGATGAETLVTVDLAPPPVVAGDPVELVGQTARVELEGPPPAIRPTARQRETFVKTKRPEADEDEGIGFAIGLSGSGHGGLSFPGQMPVFGGGVQGDVRLPLWDNRLGVRVGLEYMHATKKGAVTFATDQILESKQIIAGVIVPVEIGVSPVKDEIFELAVRVGGELRFLGTELQVGGEIFGSSSFAAAARVNLEAGITLGPGAVFVAATVSGLGASSDGLTGNNARFEGLLLTGRLDLGFRVWL